MGQDSSMGMTIGQLAGRSGLHVLVNLEGRTVDGELVAEERWEPGVVREAGGDGTFVTIKLDPPPGAKERRGLFKAARRGLIQIDDATRIRPLELSEVHPGAVPEE